MKTTEEAAKNILIEGLKDEVALLNETNAENMGARAIKLILNDARQLADRIKDAKPVDLKALYQDLIGRIVVSQQTIAIKINPEHLFPSLPKESRPDRCVELSSRIAFKRRGQELKLIVSDQRSQTSNPDPALIKLVARAHLPKVELERSEVASIKEFAAKYDMDHGDAKNLIPLCYLAPSIIEDILNGRQPAELTVSRLRSANSLPVLWSEQRKQLGFAA